MAVEDHPKYDEWSKALDTLKEANDRLRDAVRTQGKGIAAAKHDLRKAQEAFDKISEDIG